MAPKDSATIDVGYPVYAAHFDRSETLIIAGGGGEGNNGIPNKISAVAIDFDEEKPLSVVGEYEFEDSVDSPTALACAEGGVLVAVNEASAKVKKGNNKSLRKFQFSRTAAYDKESKKPVFTYERDNTVLDSIDPNEYIKHIAICKDASMSALVSSKDPSTVTLVVPTFLEIIDKIEEDHEVRDIAISDDGFRVAYVTDRSLTLLVLGAEAMTVTFNKFTSNYSLAKVRFASKDRIIVGVNLRNKAGVLLLESQLVLDEETNEMVLKTKKARVITDKFQKITAMDVQGENIVAIVGNDNSVNVVDMDDFSLCKRLEKVHTFAITRVAISPDGKYVASVSAASTVNVYKVPDSIKRKYTAVWYALYAVIFGIIVQYIYQNVSRDDLVAITARLDEFFEKLDGPTPEIQKVMVDPSEVWTLDPNFTPNTDGIPKTKITIEEKTVIEEGDIVKVKTESIAATLL